MSLRRWAGDDNRVVGPQAAADKMIRQVRNGETTPGAKQSNNVARWLVTDPGSGETLTAN
jgi:hypothetical protein